MYNELSIPEINVQVHDTNINTVTALHTNPQPKKRSLKTHLVDASSIKRFSVLTYNVWLAEDYQKERLLKIISMIREKNTDIVCLQELTVEMFKLVDARLGSYYQIFQAFISESDPYGSCIMCKKDTVKIVESDDNPYYYDYTGQTKMSRRVVGCEIEFIKYTAPKIHILTTHLESFPHNDTYRSHQVDILQGVIKPLKNCIVMGDFSISSPDEEAEKKLNEARLKDCWVEMGCPFKLKHTYNAKKNINVADKLQHRYDRVLYHSTHIKPKLMALIGRDNVSQAVSIPPSNHYGLLVEFEINEN